MSTFPLPERTPYGYLSTWYGPVSSTTACQRKKKKGPGSEVVNISINLSIVYDADPPLKQKSLHNKYWILLVHTRNCACTYTTYMPGYLHCKVHCLVLCISASVDQAQRGQRAVLDMAICNKNPTSPGETTGKIKADPDVFHSTRNTPWWSRSLVGNHSDDQLLCMRTLG